MTEEIKNHLEKEVREFVESKRPPIDIRDKVDLSYRFENGILELFEIRPDWRGEGLKIESPIARAKFIKSKNIWKIFWMRASGRWQTYDPHPEVKKLSEFFEIVKEDKLGCFWG